LTAAPARDHGAPSYRAFGNVVRPTRWTPRTPASAQQTSLLRLAISNGCLRVGWASDVMTVHAPPATLAWLCDAGLICLLKTPDPAVRTYVVTAWGEIVWSQSRLRAG
jgi:hypothetical protein